MAFRSSFAKTIVVGKLSRDPELRYLPNGSAVTNLNIPVSSKYKNKDGEMVEETTWYSGSVFGKLAELLVEVLKVGKGTEILIEGDLVPEIRIWQDKEGNNRASYELKVRDATVLTFTKNEQEPDMNDKANGDFDIPF